MAGERFLFVVPARFGSKAIPRKCMRPLAGKPLIAHVLTTLESMGALSDTVISSDDNQLRSWLKRAFPDAAFKSRPAHLADDTATLDDVVYDLCANDEGIAQNYDYVLTVQPTSPLLTSKTIENAKDALLKADTASVLTVQEKRKLTWRRDDGHYEPSYAERKNRQELPPIYEETGAVIGSRIDLLLKTKTRINPPIDLVIASDTESIDIDTQVDWVMAEHLLASKKIAFVVVGSLQNGSGHVLRALTLALEFPTQTVRFFIQAEETLAIETARSSNFEVATYDGLAELFELLDSFAPTTIINDALDSSIEYMSALKSRTKKVVTFEDLGAGARLADAVINELYPAALIDAKAYSGPQYACLRPEFIEENVGADHPVKNTLLLTFGGTDPANLTQKTLQVLSRSQYLRSQPIVIVLGRGYANVTGVKKLVKALNFPNVTVHNAVDNMAELMRQAIVAISSAGRTIYELSSCGVAVCTVCQNTRECTHLFANQANGILNFGLHSETDWTALLEAVERLMVDKVYREHLLDLSSRFSAKTGLKNVLEIIQS